MQLTYHLLIKAVEAEPRQEILQVRVETLSLRERERER